MATRLPIPGSDVGNWGAILNDYLLTSHEDDGTLKANTVGTTQIQNNSVGGLKLQDNSISSAKLSSALQAQLTALESISDGRTVALQATATHIQWRYTPTTEDPTPAWTDLVALADLKGDTGEQGEQGVQGIQGVPGDPASNIITSVNGRTGAVTGLAEATDLSAHTSNTSNPHSVTKSQVGLGNVDNTSDANKPISTATQTALDSKVTGTTSITVSSTAPTTPNMGDLWIDTD